MTDESFDRRSVLAGSVSGLALLAGCSSLPNSGSTHQLAVELGEIIVVNRHASERSLDIVVERNGDIVYWEQRTVDGAESGRAGGLSVSPPTFPGREGTWTVSVRNTNSGTFSRAVLDENLTDGTEQASIYVNPDDSIDVGFVSNTDNS